MARTVGKSHALTQAVMPAPVTPPNKDGYFRRLGLVHANPGLAESRAPKTQSLLNHMFLSYFTSEKLVFQPFHYRLNCAKFPATRRHVQAPTTKGVL